MFIRFKVTTSKQYRQLNNISNTNYVATYKFSFCTRIYLNAVTATFPFS